MDGWRGMEMNWPCCIKPWLLALDDHKTLIAASGIFRIDGIIICLYDPFAVIIFKDTIINQTRLLATKL